MNITKKILFITRKKVFIYIHIWSLWKKLVKLDYPQDANFIMNLEKNTDSKCNHVPVAWDTLIIIIKIVVYMCYCGLMFLENSDRCFWITIN